jgi:hypothetical protein
MRTVGKGREMRDMSHLAPGHPGRPRIAQEMIQARSRLGIRTSFFAAAKC